MCSSDLADIGAAAAFLASEDARYITGIRLYVDAGMDIQLRSPGVDTPVDVEAINALARLGFAGATGGE